MTDYLEGVLAQNIYRNHLNQSTRDQIQKDNQHYHLNNLVHFVKTFNNIFLMPQYL